jgi:hypothetical protein
LTRPFKIVKIFCESYIKGCEREGKDSPGFGSLAVIREGRPAAARFPARSVPVALEPPRRNLSKPGRVWPVTAGESCQY